MSHHDLPQMAESDYVEFHEMIAERKQLLARIADLEADNLKWQDESLKNLIRAGEAEAERDALRDRLCDGCALKGRGCEPYRTWGCVHPDFACNRWQPRKGGEG